MPTHVMNQNQHAELLKYKWAYELQKINSDFEYLCTHYFRIKGKHTIGMPTLTLNPVQQYLTNKMREQQKRIGKIRQIWGKSRQVGASTLVRALFCRAVFFNKNINALSIAHDDEVIKELFDTDKTFYDLLPEELKPAKKYDSTTKMEFASLRSKTLINHARNPNVGAATMSHLLHMTEAARYTDAARVYPSLEPSMSEATGDVFGSCSIRIIESTSVYGGWWFKEFAEAARDGKLGDFEFHFIPWFMHHEYKRSAGKDFEPTYEEMQWLRQYPQMSYENLAWFRVKRSEYKANPSKVYQEYPKNFDESWVLPSGTARIFSHTLIKSLGDKGLRPGVRANVEKAVLIKDVQGPVEVWEYPKEGVFYHFGLDPSGGMTDNADYSGMVVVREDTLEVVAVSQKRWNPTSPEYLAFVYFLAVAYNYAQIITDVTGGWGQAVMTELQYRGYPNIWQYRRHDDAKSKVTTRLGFHYTKKEKSNLINRSLVLIEKHQPRVNSRALLDELENFLCIGDDEWGAAPGFCDDLANGFFLAIMGAADDSPMLLEPEVEEVIIHRDPIFQHDIDAAMMEDELNAYRSIISPFTS